MLCYRNTRVKDGCSNCLDTQGDCFLLGPLAYSARAQKCSCRTEAVASYSHLAKLLHLDAVASLFWLHLPYLLHMQIQSARIPPKALVRTMPPAHMTDGTQARDMLQDVNFKQGHTVAFVPQQRCKAESRPQTRTLQTRPETVQPQDSCCRRIAGEQMLGLYFYLQEAKG